MKNLFYSVVFAFALLLTGCADAGKDQTINASDLVTLDASASTPSFGGEIKKYRWKQVKGKSVVLSNRKSPQVNFTAPIVSKKTTLVFRLVTKERVIQSFMFKSRDYVKVIVKPSTSEDTIVPVITLNGAKEITLTTEDTYIELGATASDNEDGDITSLVVTKGSVDNSKEGNYTITYNVDDKAGNHAKEVTRTVIVKLPADITPPVLTLNGGDVTLMVGDTYTEQGATATDDRDGIREVSISGNVNTSVAGTYILTYTATDLSGNMVTETRTVTVILPADVIPPVLTLNGGDVTLMVGDTYTEQGATATDDRDGIREVSISGNVNTSVAGTYILTYTATDLAENMATITRTVTINKEASLTGINGTITDIAGNALKGVKVYSMSHTTLTDGNGYYVLETNGTNPVSIVAELTNYIQNSQVVDLDINTTQNFTLVSIDKIEIFDADVGMEIKTKGAKINFPASSVANEDGTAYTGNVIAKVSYNRVTSDIGKAAFPGEYLGETTEGNTTILRSYGFIDVTMVDNESNALKIADGSSVTLTFPMDDNIDIKPATIPLWYYDTEKGIWVEDGVATYDVAANSYSGEVTHFTTWNLDAKMNRGSIEGCIEDSMGNPVNNATLVIEGAGWGSGSKDNYGSTFKFINAPTGMAISILAHTAEGTSNRVTVTLNPNENRVLSDCLQIDPQNATPYVTLKGKIINATGDLITNHIYGSIKNTLTGSQIKYVSVNNGSLNLQFVRPSNNKITLQLTLNGLSILQTYVLDPNSNILDIGDIVFDQLLIKGRLIDQKGLPVSNANIYIRNLDNTAYLSSVAAKPQTDGTFTSNAFLRPATSTAIVRVTLGERIIDINTILTGSTTDIGDIIVGGVSITGQVLDINGNPLQLTRYTPGHIYDTSTVPPRHIGRFNVNSDGSFTTSYFTSPSNGEVKIEFRLAGETITKIVTLSDTGTVNIGNISTSLNKITGLLTDISSTPIPANKAIVIDTDTNTVLSNKSINNQGLISSNYFTIPSSGNITIRFYKTYNNDIYTEKQFHITNTSTDIGTVSLAIATFKAKLLYKDGTPMPKYSVQSFIFNTDTNTSTYNYYGSSINTDNGDVNFGDFFRPTNNKIQVVIPFSKDKFIKTIHLNESNNSTYEEIYIDAVTITGTVNISGNTNNDADIYVYAPSIDESFYNGASSYSSFKYGPILRPDTNTVALKVHSTKIFGDDVSLPLVTLEADVHNTDFEEQNLTLSTLKSCINIPAGMTLNSLSVRAEPFSKSDIDTYNTFAHSNKDNGTFDAKFWQSDNNQSLYIFATDTQANTLTAQTTFIPNKLLVDLTNSCQSLEAETILEKDITVTQENYPNGNTISLFYMKRYPNYREIDIDTIANDSDILTFKTTQNGIYRIRQVSSTGKYGGLFKITIDGVTTSITVPLKTVGYAVGWNIFAIEIYQGNVRVIEENTLERPIDG